MSGRLEQIKARQAQETFDRSLPGKLWKAIRPALGVYCVYRILAVSYSVRLIYLVLNAG